MLNHHKPAAVVTIIYCDLSATHSYTTDNYHLLFPAFSYAT